MLTLDNLGDHVLYHVLTWSSVLTLAEVAACASALRVAADSAPLWADLCARLWADKALVPERFRALRATAPKRAYRESLADASRTRVTRAELCEMEWHFRFKEQAGEAWCGIDPYWAGLRANTFRFEPGGAVRQTGNGWDGEGGEGADGATPAGARRRLDVRLRWRLGGAGVRLSVDGRPVPTYVASRHRNWGWILQSCWAVYASFALPRPGADPSLDDEGLGVTVASQWEEAVLYNHRAGGDGEDEEDDDGGDDGGDEHDGGDDGEDADGEGSARAASARARRDIVVSIRGRVVIFTPELFAELAAARASEANPFDILDRARVYTERTLAARRIARAFTGRRRATDDISAPPRPPPPPGAEAPEPAGIPGAEDAQPPEPPLTRDSESA